LDRQRRSSRRLVVHRALALSAASVRQRLVSVPRQVGGFLAVPRNLLCPGLEARCLERRLPRPLALQHSRVCLAQRNLVHLVKRLVRRYLALAPAERDSEQHLGPQVCSEVVDLNQQVHFLSPQPLVVRAHRSPRCLEVPSLARYLEEAEQRSRKPLCLEARARRHNLPCSDLPLRPAQDSLHQVLEGDRCLGRRARRHLAADSRPSLVAALGAVPLELAALVLQLRVYRSAALLVQRKVLALGALVLPEPPRADLR
jgi:hypothetical protein